MGFGVLRSTLPVLTRRAPGLRGPSVVAFTSAASLTTKAATNPLAGTLFSAGVIGAINLTGFIITVAYETDKVTDLFGTGAFVVSALACSWKTKSFRHIRPLLLTGAVTLWGTRLASFLFTRILKTGGDRRFDGYFPEKEEKWLDKTKSFFPVYLGGFWLIQTMWAVLVSLPVTLTNFSPLMAKPLTATCKISLAMFLTGFGIESLADHQKSKFKENPENAGKWMDTGLYKYCRYPNYFGEMLMWWSLYGLALPGLAYVNRVISFASPAFISFLLLKVSGIPLLEKKYEKEYGTNPEFQKYKKSTNMLIPWFPKA